jgi:hypothetical protein
MASGPDGFKMWRTRIFLHISSEYPQLAAYFPREGKTDEPSAAESNQLASVLVPHLDDGLFKRFVREVIPDGAYMVNGFKLWELVTAFFQNTTALDEIPEELFGREFRFSFRDRYANIADFVRDAQRIVQRTESAASASLPVLERITAIHVLAQLSLNDFCPWASSMLASYRKAYRDSPALDSVPKGFTLNDIVETVVSHLAASSDDHRLSGRPQCTFCNWHGHVAEKCRRRLRSLEQQQGATTGARSQGAAAPGTRYQGARVNTVDAGGYYNSNSYIDC